MDRIGKTLSTKHRIRLMLAAASTALGLALASPALAQDLSIPAKEAEEETDSSETTVQGTKVYWVDLQGWFGEDISQSPIRQALKDAKKLGAEVIVFKIDANWGQRGPFKEDVREGTNDQHSFNQMFRAEAITPIFADEIPAEWGDKQPRIVFWVKQAMGGAALLPLVCKEVYFTHDGRMGGLGNLSYMMRGHDRVVQKQISLRLQHAVGWAIQGGYPYAEQLLRSMAKIEHVCSVTFEAGKPVLVERLPNGPGEELLTDDGSEGNRDTLHERAGGEGNDVLTLTARTANLIGYSKGTADTPNELFSLMGISRDAVVVKGKSERIMSNWSKGLESGVKRMEKLWQEFTEVEVEAPGEYNERTKARGIRIRKLEELRRLWKQWGEGVTQENYPTAPTEAQLQTIIEQLKLEQMMDRRN
ncbi:MAG: hypothetical protein AB7Q00_02085 [Phycisphaerales bacterium]|nr:MAG: hypothetical protein IPK69_06705 [Phycisphaerales bacterium]